MTRTMYDSVNPDAIPAGAELVGGYVDGNWAWPHDAWDRFPRAAKVRISNTPPRDVRNCSVADIETGALSVADARPFVRERNAYRAGTATVYCDLAHLPYIGKACAGLDYWAWVAWWPQVPSGAEIEHVRSLLRPGARLAAIQYRSDAAADYDLSLVLADAWHPEPDGFHAPAA